MDHSSINMMIKPLRDCLNLVFPPVMPQLIREASRSSPDFKELSRIVSTDPGLTVTILSLANSPYYGLSHKVNDLQRAMVILGSSEILKLAMAVTLKKSLTRKMSKCDHIEYKNWAVILWSAMSSELLAREAGLREADSIYICALIKDLSLLLLCCSEDPRLEKFRSLCMKGSTGLLTLKPGQLEDESHVWGADHSVLTMELLERWGFPKAECRMIAFHHDLENIRDHDRAIQMIILGTYWAEVEMSDQAVSQLFRVRTIAKNILGLDNRAFDELREKVALRFRTMCLGMGLSPGSDDAVHYQFPVERIQDLYFAAQEIQEIQGDVQVVVKAVAKHFHWLWGIDELDFFLVSPLTGEKCLFRSLPGQGPKRMVFPENKGAGLQAGIQFYLGDEAYLQIKKNIDEDILAEIDLYTNFLNRSYADYCQRSLNTFSKARILDFMPVAVARVSREGKILQVNDRFSQVFHTTEDPAGMDFWNMFTELVQIDQEKSWLDFLASEEEAFSWLYCPLEAGLENPDIACWHLSAGRIEMDGSSQILVMLQDITEISTLERDVFRQAEYLRGIINSMQDIVFTVDARGKILFASPKYKKDLLGRNLFELAKPSSTLATAWGPDILESTSRPVEVNLFIGDSGRSLEVIFTRLSNSVSPQYLVVGRDLTVIRRLEEKIRKQATFDYLTKVFNRHQFSIFLERETQRASRKSARLGLVFFDLDMFKEFNDRHGHQRGDQALKDFGRLLIASSRRGMDYPFRFGGDEFVLLVSEATPEVMEDIAGRIVASFEKEFEHDLSLSIGMALMNKGEDRNSFVNRADKALFQAKEIPGNARVWAENNQER